MDIPILYEDDDVVVIDKPAGVLVHGPRRARSASWCMAPAAGAGESEETVADWHLRRVPSAAGVGEPLILPDGTLLARPGIVHRLDRETSGVLILAKTPGAFAHLKAQFHDRLAEKEYRAFVYGRVAEERGVITRPIGRSAKDFRALLREAETAWERIAVSPAYSYLRLSPKTGRRHQLRAHLKAINHPVLEDALYAGKRRTNDLRALGLTRLALHARSLTLTLPSGARRTFTAPLPAEFLRAEELLKRNAHQRLIAILRAPC